MSKTIEKREDVVIKFAGDRRRRNATDGNAVYKYYGVVRE